MPPDRSRPSKRQGVDGAHLTWATQVEPPSPRNIAFTPNVTPITYNDPPTSVEDTPTESILFPPLEDCPTGRRPPHSKKKPENHIPRPPNAFILFRSSFIKSQHVSTEVETNHSTLSKIIGLTWQNLPHEERQVWHAKAKAALDEHKRRFPSYAFRPAHTRGKGGTEKRKVREVGPKDVKRCEKIAELLVEGKKGEELDAAIQEFDRHHVPEVVTRFEAPLTSRTYHRSSSAPAADTDSEKFLRSTTSSPRSQRARAASTQPTRNPSPSPSPTEAFSPIELCPTNFYEVSAASGYPSSPEFSFPPKTEPSFEFNPFLFEEAGMSYPPTPASGDHNSVAMYLQETSERHRAPLSITTSFSQDWMTASPFSSSPSTPQLYSQLHSPCMSNVSSATDDTFVLGNFNLDSEFDQVAAVSAFDRPLDMDTDAFLASQFSEPLPKDVFNHGPFEHSKPQLAMQDPYFAAFMSSLHSSTYTI